jgi:glycosyltransferase involved in cell wall biosynthesis
VRRHVTSTPLISVVIPTRGSAGIVRGSQRVFVIEAVRSILERSTYSNLEFVVVADRDTPQIVTNELFALLGDRLRLIWFEPPFNYSRKINRGVAFSSGGLLLLLNDDIEVISPQWIETMLAILQQQDVGLVGAMLYFEDGTIQHAGHVYRKHDPGHVAYEADGDQPGPFCGLRVERECSGVTAACAMTKASVFFSVGGLSPLFPMNFNDVDFSLKVRAAGWRIVWTPHAELYHFESKSRTRGATLSELNEIEGRWGRFMEEDIYWRHEDRAQLIYSADALGDLV